MKANGWPIKTLGELCILRPPKAEARRRLKPDSPVSFLPMEDLGIDEKYPIPVQTRKLDEVQGSYTYFADGDVLLAKVTPCFQNGKLGVAEGLCNGVGFGSSEFFVFRPHAELISDYLYYFLSRADFRDEGVKRMGGAVGLQRVPPEFVLNESLPVPPLAEQRRIVGILDSAFAGIATVKAHAEQNRRNARALFESHLNAVFTQRGEGWVETTIDKLSTNLDSKRIPITKGVRSPGEYPYYGASGIVDYVADYIFEGDTLLVSEDGANLLARSTPIAFSVTGKYWVNNHAHILKFDNMTTQRFVEFYLESTKLDEFITGAAQPKLNQKALNSIPIPIPTAIEAQRRIVNSIEELSAEIQRLESLYEKKLAALDELKKSLLHQAFSGELAGQTSLSLSMPVAPTVEKPSLARFPGLPPDMLHAGVLALSYQLHKARGNLNEFGHVKAEKIVQMVEGRLLYDLERTPVKEAAGPLDFQKRRWVDGHAQSKKWFAFEQNGVGRYEFHPLGKIAWIVSHTKLILGPKLTELDALLQWMLPMKWQQAEIVATVYAGWNNLLLDGKQPTDEEIVYESRENWHPDKLKIARDRFFKAIDWMRKEDVVPSGKGKRVFAKVGKDG